MVHLLMSRALAANHFCQILYWVGKCGVPEAARWGFRPGAPSGHYARHLEPLLGHGRENPSLYQITVPGHHKHDLERTLHPVTVMPAHEQVADDLAGDATFRNRLAERRADRSLPPAYWEHPVVRDAGDAPVAPLAFYVDGVPYSQSDSVLGWWVINLISQRRYLVAVLRKRLLCKCGCKGWCTLYPFFALMRWSFDALARGVWPAERHDHAPWQPLDSRRAERAGSPFHMRCACLFVKGDWSEYSSTLGFPSWSDSLRPCFQRVAFGDDMFTTEGNTSRGLVWRVNQAEDYLAACLRCEVPVRLNARTRAICLERLRFDRRAGGSRGLSLTHPIPELGLRAGDRLEPSEHLPDVALLADAPLGADGYLPVVFWRTSEETLCRHRNPLFTAELGLLPSVCLTIDTMHCLYLGVFKKWCSVAIWALLRSGCYANVGAAEENLTTSVIVLRRLLMQWYEARHRARPSEGLTRLHDLTVKMCGTAAKPDIKVKAAECWGLLLFLVEELARLAARLGPDGVALQEAGACLVQLVEAWQACDLEVPAAVQEAPRTRSTTPTDRQRGQSEQEDAHIHASLSLSLALAPPHASGVLRGLLDARRPDAAPRKPDGAKAPSGASPSSQRRVPRKSNLVRDVAR